MLSYHFYSNRLWRLIHVSNSFELFCNSGMLGDADIPNEFV